MSQEFTFSDPGEGLQEGEILEVHVSAGDTVSDGDIVLTIETDKANTDIPAPFDGTIDEVQVSEGETVEIGDVLMTYSEGGASDSGSDESEQDESSAESGEADSEQREDSAGSGEEDSEQSEDSADSEEEDSEQGENSDSGQDESGSEQDQESDEDKRDEEAEDKESSQKQKSKSKGKSGKQEGKKKKDDTKKDEGKQDKNQSGQEPSKQSGDKQEPVPAAPSTRRLAREKGVDLHKIEPSGEHGRVTSEDVEAAAQTAEGQKDEGSKGKDQQRGNALIPGGGEAPALPDFSQWGETERMPLRSIRRATAQNMARSWGQIPHVYHQDIADVTELDRFRREHEDAAEADGGKFTLTVLVMKALASALKQFPRFNASLDPANQEIVLKHYCHIGLAVATDRGLLVPVIRDVDQKTLVELTTEAADIARKTRNGEVSREDMQGGSMTVTNPGSMGGTSLTPLINHPQVAILGMAQTRLEPVVHGTLEDYEIKPRLRLPVVLGFDHRVNDGAEAAKFVTHLIDTLADPESLLLNL